MLGDEFTKECRSLEKYIQLLLVHPVFSNDENLRKFLIDEEVLPDILTVVKIQLLSFNCCQVHIYLFQLPARVKVKKGILNSLSKTVDEVRFNSHKVSILSCSILYKVWLCVNTLLYTHPFFLMCRMLMIIFKVKEILLINIVQKSNGVQR